MSLIGIVVYTYIDINLSFPRLKKSVGSKPESDYKKSDYNYDYDASTTS